MGYVRGFVHGGLAGVVAGLCIAPQPGVKTRQQLASFGAAAREGYDIAERTVRRVVPLAGAAASVAREQVGRSRNNDDDDIVAGVRIHNQTNGRR